MRASPPGERREVMDAVINLKHEPALRAALALNPVHGNTVLVDRRT